ncbi:MAG: NRDE family protein [Proteobacteria bacterium]|nr:NRDE family protein [Pseudomonadota bacterium]HQR02515.1 NRDE family protein [Rhodocyclaceae bacterium]
MCLILFAWRHHPDYPLIVAANRDEFHDRPASPAGFWPEHTSLLAGRDLRAGGTWLGVTRHGRFAALTNVRQRQREGAPSRGDMVKRFLLEAQSPEEYVDRIETAGIEYSGFNLLLGDGSDLLWYSNVGQQRYILEPGIYGLSNDQLDTPWPKVEYSKSAIRRALDRLPDESPLFHLLRDATPYPEGMDADASIDIGFRNLLSAAFVLDPRYGTRNSTVFLHHRDGTRVLDEQLWQPDGTAGQRSRYRF